jgi:hypothetical protein
LFAGRERSYGRVQKLWPHAQRSAGGTVSAFCGHLSVPPEAFSEGKAMKSKKVAGVDLGSDCFAFVGNVEDPKTWKLPIYVPGNVPLSRNLLKSALYRFADTKDIPASERRTVALTLNGAAKAMGIRVQQPPSTLPVNVHPETAQAVDALDAETKATRAMGSLYADRLLEKIEMEWVK